MSLRLSWVDRNAGNNEETAYRIYRNTVAFTAADLPPVLATVAANTEGYLDTAVADNTVYYYMVEAVRPEGSRFTGLVTTSTGNPVPVIIYDWAQYIESPNTGDHQGVARDDTHYYTIHNTRLAKFDRSWKQLLERANPLSDIPGASGSMIDGFVKSGVLYVVRNNTIFGWNTSDLTPVSPTGVAITPAFSFSSVSNGPNEDNIYGVVYSSSNQIIVYNRLTGAFVENITLSQTITGAQGLCYGPSLIGNGDAAFYITAADNKLYHVTTLGAVTEVLSVSGGTNIEGCVVDGTDVLILWDGSIQGVSRARALPQVTQTPSGTVTPTVVNADAETGDTSGWIVRKGQFLATGGPSGAIPAPNQGSYLFWGGTASESIADQRFFVPAEAVDEIDAGNATVDISWWQAGDPAAGTKDQGRIVSRFFDKNGTQIGVVIGPYRSSPETWAQYSLLAQAVPANTRSYSLEIQMDRQAGTQNNSYFESPEITLNW